MKDLLKEFKQVRDAEWTQRLQEDLKGESLDKLLWKDENLMSHKAYYRFTDLQKIVDLKEIQKANQIAADWEIVQHLSLNEENFENVEKSIQTALSNGADSVMLYSNISASKIENLFNAQHFQMGSIKFIIPWEKYTANSKLPYLFDPISDAMVRGKKIQNEELQKFTGAFTGESIHRVVVNASIYKNAGCNQVQEIAYALQHAVEYLDVFTENSYSALWLAENILFKFGMSSSLFPEIAKIRAFRYLWRKVTAAYDVNVPANIHAVTSTYYLADIDVYNNLLRESIQMMAAAIAPCNSISTLSFDLDPNNEFGQRMARNIQIILKEETYLNKVVDPSAGSFYIEELSAKFAEAAWELFMQLESKAGLIKAYERGEIQDSINDVHQKRLQGMIEGQSKQIGVNVFVATQDSEERMPTGKAQKNTTGISALQAINLSTEYLSTEYKESSI